MELDELLENLRKQIDTIDEEFIYMLSRRFELVKQIGNIKKKIGAEAFQPKRWEEILKNLYDEADDKGVNKIVIKDMWDIIHNESLRIEK